jgi:flagellar biosynthesis/type III secretory pathway M-ring protein FliF/YscJ
VATAPKAPARPLAAPEPMAALPQPDELRPRTPIDQVRDLAKSDPATVANVVKAWVGEGKS